MRDLVISQILNSRYWITCINNGMQDEMPDVSKLSEYELLDLYSYARNWR